MAVDRKGTRKIAVVTPVHNRKDITLLCLRSLSRVKREGLQLEITIVDDGSTDGTSDAVKAEYPDVNIIHGDGSLWFTGGMNRGIMAAMKGDPDYVLAINNDSIFDEAFLERMVSCAERHPRSVVGPLLLLWDQPHRVFQVSPRWETLSGGVRHWQQQTIWTVPESAWETELIVGNCVLFPADAIRECGLMNERRLPHYGDAEYTPRMRRAGWRLLIEPSARVFCQPNTPPPSVRKMGLKKQLRTLFFDLGNASSLRRRFYGNWYAAPNKLKAIAALPIFYSRYLLGLNLEGEYALKIRELPLKELFAAQIVDPVPQPISSRQNSIISSSIDSKV